VQGTARLSGDEDVSGEDMRDKTIVMTVLLLVMIQGSGHTGPRKFPWQRVAGVHPEELKEEFVTSVEQELEKVPCYGSCQESVASCLRRGQGTTAARLARGVLSLMAKGADHQKVLDWVNKRKLMAHPEMDHSFDLQGKPPLGKPQAPVVIVEFTDFKCPFCARLAPLLEKVVKESPGQVRLYMKLFPLKSHPGSVQAAKACVAAGRLGRFWQYCPLLFTRQKDLDNTVMEQLARQVGLDVEAFRAELAKDEVVEQVANEKMEGLRALIRGTPAVFVNGKYFLLEPTEELLRDRIAEELDILHGRD